MTDHLLAVSVLELLVGGVCLWLAALPALPEPRHGAAGARALSGRRRLD